MKVLGSKIVKNIQLGQDSEMSVEISELLIEKIKEEYDIEKVEDIHIKYFFRDVLKDASTNLIKN
jgi:hypothetical protein|tara:strand:+ start:135 stop:329 length:195 start_codon:yes stop_codon:yes gene_type:complete